MSTLGALVFLLAGLTAHQGEAIRLTVPDKPEIEKVEIQWQGRRVPYVRAGDVWATVLGVDLEVKAGEYPGQVRVTTNRGAIELHEVTIEVRPVNYPTTQLKVADKYVQLSQANQVRAAQEAKELESIDNTISSEALWIEPFLVPITGGRGTNFGHRRVFNGEARAPHSGADLRAGTGTPIHSSNRGRVVLAKNLFFTGNTVVVDHGLGIYMLYAHLSRIDVKKDQMVDRGQVVGLAGATGRVTGPHLHWGARVQNARVDPFSLVEMNK